MSSRTTLPMPASCTMIPDQDLDARVRDADLAGLREAALRVEQALDRWSGLLAGPPGLRRPILGWPAAIVAGLVLVFV